jgi:hypothetical protein
MLSPATTITLSTVRLFAYGGPEGDSVGTGYFYQFPGATSDTYVPVIITNKHVINGRKYLNLNLQIFPVGSNVMDDGSVAGEIRYPITVELTPEILLQHPDPEVDLCAVLIGASLRSIPPGMIAKCYMLGEEARLTNEEIEFTRPLEPILMVGYPNGLWDELNNRPIARQGTTASHPLRAWNGKRYFVIDAACFPGSSGSPVFLYEDGMYREGPTEYKPGTRAKLIGTLWGGPVFTAEGNLVPKAIPTSAGYVPQLNVMMNLGYVVAVDAIDDLHELLKSRA